MRYRNLGGTGMQVSAICLGAMAFGAGNDDPEDCARIVHYALDNGVNFIDTADRYSNSRSEEILGGALKGRRDEVVLASKFGLPAGEGLNRRGGSRRWVMQAVEASLRRLQTDWIDLYQLHSPDFGTDQDETLGALSELVRAGKVRAIGASNTPPERIVEGQWIARSAATCASAASSRSTRSSSASLSATSSRPSSSTGWGRSSGARSMGAGSPAATEVTRMCGPSRRARSARRIASTSPSRATRRSTRSWASSRRSPPTRASRSPTSPSAL